MSHLLVLNYSMDENSPALAHQIEVSRKLSGHFDRVTVLTGFRGAGFLPSNVEVISSNWLQGHRVRNTYNFLRIALRILRTNKPDVVFSHMTHIQSALLLPFTRCKGIPHYLWYAHASSSLALRWDYLLVDKVLSSTKGSFPLSGEKVIYIGQAVDEEMFSEAIRRGSPVKFVHYGRFDISKGIDAIIDSTESAREVNQEISLTICGNPSNAASRIHANQTISKNQKNIEAGWLTFVEAIPRREIPEWLKSFDVLIHAFQGSLDKVLVESVIAGLTVVSVNSEFISEFGSWGEYSDSEKITLKSELDSMMGFDANSRYEFNLLRQNRALKNHTETKWIETVRKILMSAV
jgi:glycosyltransferase involved in cell wall biosynthesis